MRDCITKPLGLIESRARCLHSFMYNMANYSNYNTDEKSSPSTSDSGYFYAPMAFFVIIMLSCGFCCRCRRRRLDTEIFPNQCIGQQRTVIIDDIAILIRSEIPPPEDPPPEIRPPSYSEAAECRTVEDTASCPPPPYSVATTEASRTFSAVSVAEESNHSVVF